MHFKLRDGRLVHGVYHKNSMYRVLTEEKLFERSTWDEKFKRYCTMIDPLSNEVEEAFEVMPGVICPTEVQSHSNEWTIWNSNEVWTGEVYLHGYNYPGWEFIDRGESRKLVSLKDCKGQFLQKCTHYRNGRKLDPYEEKKVYLSMLDFKRGIVFYDIDGSTKVLSDYEGEPFLFQDEKNAGPSILEGLKLWING